MSPWRKELGSCFNLVASSTTSLRKGAKVFDRYLYTAFGILSGPDCLRSGRCSITLPISSTVKGAFNFLTWVGRSFGRSPRRSFR